MRLSKKFYLLSIGIGWGGPLLMLIPSVIEKGWPSDIVFDDPFVFFVLELPIVYASAVNLYLWHRMWAAINDGKAEWTPNLAVLPLLVPVLNVFYIFRTLVGWVTEYNAYTKRHSLEVFKLRVGLNRAYPVLCVLTVPIVFATARSAPAVGMIALIGDFVVGLLLAGKICNAVNALTSKCQAPIAKAVVSA